MLTLSIKTNRTHPVLRHPMATPTNRTYSEFFASGLRAMSGTSNRGPFAGSASPVPPSTPSNALNSSGRYNVLRSLARRSRTMSSPTSASMSENTTPTTSTRHKRRSSIVDLPARLLERMKPSPDTCSKSSDRAQAAPYLPRNSTSYEKIRPVIDPFDASPSSSSFFIDLVETDITPSSVSIPPPAPPLRRAQSHRPQSFLLLGEPTKISAYLPSPLRRARPVSIQSMPLPRSRPSQSRRSSFQFRPASSEREKHDRAWALQEDEDADSDLTFSPGWSDDVGEVNDPAATIDWRQFHIDLLIEDL
ncbi:hypothetical protein B0H16DRAFT_181947 [Mycena metata]|uniref:Uncharacterized protein n=1 Tax=Mycena metata TaxID=1033252 RepID=A0AAD7MU87_9AGAR|nr:hypothetical protein B0H16DRAFT_181947 [Mycena metata]